MQCRAPVTTHTAQVLAQRASQMRAVATTSESRLWSALRANHLGTPFRRQVVIGRMIVDFLAPSARLVVEVDGRYHAQAARARADERRDRKLRRLGYRVLRLEAELVEQHIEQAVAFVLAALADQPP